VIRKLVLPKPAQSSIPLIYCHKLNSTIGSSISVFARNRDPDRNQRQMVIECTKEPEDRAPSTVNLPFAFRAKGKQISIPEFRTLCFSHTLSPYLSPPAFESVSCSILPWARHERKDVNLLLDRQDEPRDFHHRPSFQTTPPYVILFDLERSSHGCPRLPKQQDPRSDRNEISSSSPCELATCNPLGNKGESMGLTHCPQCSTQNGIPFSTCHSFSRLSHERGMSHCPPVSYRHGR
jgi:hypothetical protein